MKWLEIIELRSSKRHQAAVAQGLAELTDGWDTEPRPRAIQVYRNLSVDTDWSVHLHFEAKNKSQKDSKKEHIEECKKETITKSTLGLRLALELKKFGLVHHSLWKQDQPTREKED